MQLSRIGAAVVAGLGMGMVGACSDAAPTEPSAAAIRPSAVLTTPAATTSDVESGKIKICKSGGSPAGTYTFTVTFSGQSPTESDLYSTAASVAPGQCVTVYDRQVQLNPNPTPGSPGPVTYATITEAAASGTECSSIDRQTTEANTAALPAPTCPTVVAGANYFHGTTVTYTNVAVQQHVTVCTYTQGYYKNRGAWMTLAAFSNFDNTGYNGVQILEMAPKGGNGYLILAHQYIAAYLNIQRLIDAGGSLADLPTDVREAYLAAQAYFATSATIANPYTGMYNKEYLTQLAGVLGAFNEGAHAEDGFSHCD